MTTPVEQQILAELQAIRRMLEQQEQLARLNNAAIIQHPGTVARGSTSFSRDSADEADKLGSKSRRW